MLKIELTAEEAQALVNLIDAAVRATGLNNATAAAILFAKIQDATKVVESDAAAAVLAAQIEQAVEAQKSAAKTKAKEA